MNRLILALLLLGSALACDADYAIDREQVDFDFDVDAAQDAAAAEQPVSSFVLSAPAASQNFVFVANTTRGTLAKMRVVSGTVRISTIPVGASPTTLAASPDSDTVVVFNDGTSSVTVVDGEAETSVAVDVVPGATRLTASSNVRYAVAWHRPSDTPFGNARPLSEVSVVDVEQATSVRLSVGVGVQGVRFSADGERVAIITSEGVSVAELSSLTTDGFAPPQPYATEIVLPLDAVERLAISADITTAVAVVRDSAELRIMDLERATLERLPLAAIPSSVVIVGRRAIASLSDGTLATVDLRDATLEVVTIALPSVVSDSAVAPDGNTWLGFDGDADDGVLTVVDLAQVAVTQLDLRKGIAAIVFAPDGGDAVVLHTKAPGAAVAGAPESEIIAKSYAVSLLNLVEQTSKLVLTASAATEVTFTEGVAFVLTPAAGALVAIDRQSLRAEQYVFEREPEHIGVVPGAGEVFVSQSHPLGRIAFVDIASGEVREITGYELNGLIE